MCSFIFFEFKHSGTQLWVLLNNVPKRGLLSVLDRSARVLETSVQVFGYGRLSFGPKGWVMSLA